MKIKYIEEGAAPGWYWWAGVNDMSGREMNDGPFSTSRKAIEDYISAFESEKTVLEIAQEAGVEDEDNFDERFSQ